MRSIINLLSVAAILMFVGCTKSDDDDDLVGNWVRRSDFEGVTRTEAFVAVTADNRVFTGFGFDGDERLTDIWEYSSEGDTWTPRKDFPGVARSSAIAFSAGNKVYVGLGYDGVNYLKDFWEYDPQGDTWTQKADFPASARTGAVAFSINDMGYVTAGYDGNFLKDFWQYNPGDDSWTKKPSPGGFKRNDAVAFVIDGKAYLCTGVNNGDYVNDFYVYDPGTETWTDKRRLTDYDEDLDYDDDYTTITRSNAVAFVMNGKGYITTGINGSYRANTWEYNPTTDLWQEKTSFEGTAREGAIGFSVNNRGYVGLGASSNYRFDDLREFYPEEEYEEND